MMRIFLSIKEAFRSINANKTRAFLTILGIVIGVGSVIALLAIGQGAESSITGEIESIILCAVTAVKMLLIQNR